MATPQHRRARSITSLLNLRGNDDEGRRPTVLNVLISAYQVRWRTVEERISTHGREEASILDSGGCSVLYRAIVRRADDYPPGRIVRKIVSAHPASVWERYDNTTLIELACWRMASLETLEVLTQSRPAIPEDASALRALWQAYCTAHGDEETFLLYLRSQSAEAFEVGCKFQLLLRYLTTEQMLPCTLETALSSPFCSLELFVCFCNILQKFPNSLQPHLLSMPENDVSSLIDMLRMARCQASQSNVQSAKIKHLLSLNSLDVARLAHQEDSDGQLPLHVALEGNLVNEDLLRMLSAGFKTMILSTRDPKTGFLPFQMVVLDTCDASLITIYHLLRPVPDLLRNLDSVAPPTLSSRMTKCTESENSDTLNIPNEPVWVTPALEQMVKVVDHDMHAELANTLRARPNGSGWNQIIGASRAFQCPPKLMQLLIDLHPEMLREPDSHGWLPLHHAIMCQRGDDHEILSMIIDAYPEACKHRDKRGRLPFHLACCSGKSIWLLDKLLEIYPLALDERDHVECLPPAFLAAQSQRASLNNVFHLLIRSPDVVMRQEED